jgi:hypothetical protein
MSTQAESTELIGSWRKGGPPHCPFSYIETVALQTLPSGGPQAQSTQPSSAPSEKTCRSVKLVPGRHVTSPNWKMQSRNSGGRGASSGMHAELVKSPQPDHPRPWQARAKVVPTIGITFAGSGAPGMHPCSTFSIGATVSECATPGDTWIEPSHWPSHSGGASKEDTDPPGRLHAFVLTVNCEGSAQVPVGGWQVHSSQMPVLVKSA